MTNEPNFTIKDREISGDITPSRRNTETQRTPAEFLSAVDAILAIPRVEAIRWSQYTPYFADGDPCEFSVNDLELKVAGVEAGVGGEYEDGFYDTWTLGYYAKREGWTLPEGLIETVKQNWSARAFESVALANFGDHATVVATSEGFSVEYLEHD